MNENKFKDGNTICVCCGKPMTDELGTMICCDCLHNLHKMNEYKNNKEINKNDK